MNEPLLVVLSGLPGVGKSSVARELARQTGLFHLRVDAIEDPFLSRGIDVAGSGYEAMRGLAQENLALGIGSIIDCVNPWPLTRDMFVLESPPHRRITAELFCSDPETHQQRMLERGLGPEHLDRAYVPWTQADLRLDTAARSPSALATEIAGFTVR